jgi:hypothetical protein
MKQLGIVLIGIGVVALIYTGFTFTTKEKVLDLGPIEIKKEKKHNISWPPIAGAVLIVGGVILMVMDKKK